MLYLAEKLFLAFYAYIYLAIYPPSVSLCIPLSFLQTPDTATSPSPTFVCLCVCTCVHACTRVHTYTHLYMSVSLIMAAYMSMSEVLFSGAVATSRKLFSQPLAATSFLERGELHKSLPIHDRKLKGPVFCGSL